MYQDASVQCCCSGRGVVLVGDNKGFVHCLSRSLESGAPSFPAHDAPVTGLWATDTAPVIVSLAVSDGNFMCSTQGELLLEHTQQSQIVMYFFLANF